MGGAQGRGRSPSGTMSPAGARGPDGAPAGPGGVEEDRSGRRVRTGAGSFREDDQPAGRSGWVTSEPVSDADEVSAPGRVTGRQLRELLADDAWLDELIDRSEQGGVALTGPGGFLPEMIKAVLERGLAAELERVKFPV